MNFRIHLFAVAIVSVLAQTSWSQECSYGFKVSDVTLKQRIDGALLPSSNRNYKDNKLSIQVASTDGDFMGGKRFNRLGGTYFFPTDIMNLNISLDQLGTRIPIESITTNQDVVPLGISEANLVTTMGLIAIDRRTPYSPIRQFREAVATPVPLARFNFDQESDSAGYTVMGRMTLENDFVEVGINLYRGCINHEVL